PYDEHRLGTVPGPDSGDQPARERTRRADRRRVGPAMASAHRPVRDVHRQGFSAWSERGTDHARRHCAADGCDPEEVAGLPGHARAPTLIPSMDSGAGRIFCHEATKPRSHEEENANTSQVSSARSADSALIVVN